MKHGQAIDLWAQQQFAATKDEDRKKKLQKLREEIRLADANRYPAGSPQHTLALFHQKSAMKNALSLGYEPPEKALAEIGVHALDIGLGV